MHLVGRREESPRELLERAFERNCGENLPLCLLRLVTFSTARLQQAGEFPVSTSPLEPWKQKLILNWLLGELGAAGNKEIAMTNSYSLLGTGPSGHSRSQATLAFSSVTDLYRVTSSSETLFLSRVSLLKKLGK